MTTSKQWNYQKWTDGYVLALMTAYVKRLVVIGKVTDMSDLANFVIRLTSTSDVIDYNSFKVTELSGGLVQIESELESVHRTKMTISYPNPQVFSEIVSGFLEFELTQE